MRTFTFQDFGLALLISLYLLLELLVFCYQHLSHLHPFKNIISSAQVACVMAQPSCLTLTLPLIFSFLLLAGPWPLHVWVLHHSVVRLLILLKILRNFSWIIDYQLFADDSDINISCLVLALEPQTHLPYRTSPVRCLTST